LISLLSICTIFALLSGMRRVAYGAPRSCILFRIVLMLEEALKKQIEKELPYSPNADQCAALELLSAFVLGGVRDAVFLLRGYAGTGKTSLVGACVKVLTSLGYKTVLLAPTGRAAKVFSLYSGHPAFTIHKKIYRQKSYSPDMEGFLVADNLHKDTLFIVDEASMIANSSGEATVYGSGHLLDDLIEYVYSGEGCRLLMLGDSAQLPPVGQSASPALDSSFLKGYGLNVIEYELREVARQELDSGILFNATMLRSTMETSPIGMPSLKVVGFPDLEVVSGEFLVERIADSYDRVGLDETIVVTRSNKRANIFNQGIRNQILYREEELTSGDLLLVAKNNYYWGKDCKEIDFIANGDVARVVRVRRVVEMYGFRFADVSLYFPDREVELDTKIILDTLSSESPALSYEQNNRLFENILADYYDVPSKREKYKRLKADPWFNALQVKYAYGVTCHKAQGGQWRHAYIDMGGIHPEQIGLDFYRWLYTALTRATEKVYLINYLDPEQSR